MVKHTDSRVGWPQLGCVIIAKLHYIFLGTTRTTTVMQYLSHMVAIGLNELYVRYLQ